MSRKKKEKKLSQPHAKTFEYLLKEKETAASLLKEYLPGKISENLDFDSYLQPGVKEQALGYI
jgi:hypothetical protein